MSTNFINNNDNKICIHNYLKQCETIGPPGLTDFLRGTISLYEYSKLYNYKLYINRSIHPVFKYFKECEYYIHDTESSNCTFELLSQANPLFIDHILKKLFQTGASFSVITNCLLNDNISADCREFLLKILEPSELIKYKYIDIMNKLHINRDYYAIHIRFGDKFLCENNMDIDIINQIQSTIKNIIQTNNKNIILVTDSESMSIEIIKKNKELFYWYNKKIHLGGLLRCDETGKKYNEDAIIDTLVDFVILSKSEKIFTINISNQFQTTFSPLIAKIFNIENIIFQVKYCQPPPLMRIISLILYEPPFKKIRLGKDNDGGYIICDIPNITYDIFISCGIDNDISFEESFCEKYKNINCYAFDGTIENIKTKNNDIIFIKKNIDCINSDLTTNLFNMVDNHKSIFIKMDIEGSEYKWLRILSDEQLNNISQFVIVFHYEFDDILFNRINKYFYLVHFHANNFCGFRKIEGASIPYVFECTYVNKKYFECVPDLNTKILPTELDMPKIKEMPEYLIDFYPFVN